VSASKAPEELVIRYAVVITAFLAEILVFCLVGQGIIAEVGVQEVGFLCL